MILISEFTDSEIRITSIFSFVLTGKQANRISLRKTSNNCWFRSAKWSCARKGKLWPVQLAETSGEKQRADIYMRDTLVPERHLIVRDLFQKHFLFVSSSYFKLSVSRCVVTHLFLENCKVSVKNFTHKL